MNRLALAVALAALPLATGGCLFLTPPTGVCVTDECRKFEQARQAAADAAAAAAGQPAPGAPLQYRAPDFELTFPGIWGELALTTTDAQGQETTAPLRDQTEASGVSTLRIAVGGLVPTTGGQSASEGIRVITLNAGFDPANEAQAMAAIADIARRSIALSFEGTPEIAEAKAPLGGKPDAYQVSMLGKSKGSAVDLRVIARATLHRKRGYIVLLSTLESRYSQATAAYDGLFDGFKLLEADPTYVIPSPAPAASGSPGASPAPGTSPAPGASPAPTASGVPSTGPSATPSPAPNATTTPAAGESPVIK